MTRKMIPQSRVPEPAQTLETHTSRFVERRETMSKKRWQSTPPTHCQVCEEALVGVFIDGVISSGLRRPWAITCELCHQLHGYGLGAALGQKYDLVTLEKLEG